VCGNGCSGKRRTFRDGEALERAGLADLTRMNPCGEVRPAGLLASPLAMSDSNVSKSSSRLPGPFPLPNDGSTASTFFPSSRHARRNPAFCESFRTMLLDLDMAGAGGAPVGETSEGTVQ